MSVLVINGTAYTCQRGGHAAPRTVGSKPIGFSGEETSSIRAELMVVPVVLTELTPTAIATLRTLFKNGAQVSCSGDVFNNSSATVVCSGVLSDEFLPAGPWFVGSLTLYEIGTSLGYAGSGTTTFGLTTTPAGGGSYVASPTPGIGFACFRVLDSATPATCSCGPSGGNCATTFSAVPEITWVTDPLAAGTMTGQPYCRFISKGINGGSGIGVQSTKAILYQVRGGVDIASWDSNYAAGTFFGGYIYMYFPAGLLVTINANDTLRVELWGRLALTCGSVDPQPYVLARQTICYPGELYVSSGVTLLAP